MVVGPEALVSQKETLSDELECSPPFFCHHSHNRFSEQLIVNIVDLVIDDVPAEYTDFGQAIQSSGCGSFLDAS
jgi:hypothetical protein